MSGIIPIPTWENGYEHAIDTAIQAHLQGKNPVLVKVAYQDFPAQDVCQLLTYYGWPLVAVPSRFSQTAQDDPQWRDAVQKALDQYHEGW